MVSNPLPTSQKGISPVTEALPDLISYKNSLIYPFSNHVKVVEIIPRRPGLYFTIGRTAPRRVASANCAGDLCAGVFFPGFGSNGICWEGGVMGCK
jgi:hypothetical protein